MAPRRKGPPAPWFVKLFWAGGVVVAVVLGPLLLLRADWMWGPDNPDRRPGAQGDVQVKDVQDRLMVDLLAGAPWVVHATVVGDVERSALIEPLVAGRWTRLEDPAPDSDPPREILFRHVERSGARADVYLIVDTWSDAAAAARRFVNHVAGREPEVLESDDLRLRAGGRAQLLVWMSTTSPAAPAVESDRRVPTRGVLVSTESGAWDAWADRRETLSGVHFDAVPGAQLAARLDQRLEGR